MVGRSVDLDGALGRLLRNRLEVSALGNGLKGGKWFSLVDKVHRSATLEAAWRKVQRNKGSSGIDGQSIDRFAAGAARSPEGLHGALERAANHPPPANTLDIR